MFVAPSSFPADADGFGRPPAGGTLAVKHAVLTFEDATATRLFTIPHGAIPVAWLVDVQTAFDAGTSNVIDLGTSDTADAYAADLAVGTAGQITSGFTGLFTQLTEDTDVYGVYTEGGGAATEGTAVVALIYYMGAV